MQYKFDTESEKRGKAALILYAMYKSRGKNSPMNGKETWSRFVSYIKGACLKSTTTAEFVDNFCKMGKIESIKPMYLSTDGFIKLGDGSLVSGEGIKEYKIGFLEDNSLMEIFEKEEMLLSMLVRERIQREKMEGVEDEIED